MMYVTITDFERRMSQIVTQFTDEISGLKSRLEKVENELKGDNKEATKDYVDKNIQTLNDMMADLRSDLQVARVDIDEIQGIQIPDFRED